MVSIALLGQRIAEGQSFLRAGRIEDALRLGRSLPDDWPRYPQAHAFLAEVHNLNGDFPAALECIEFAISQDDDPQYKVKKAWLLSRANRRGEMLGLLAGLAEESSRDALAVVADRQAVLRPQPLARCRRAVRAFLAGQGGAECAL